MSTKRLLRSIHSTVRTKYDVNDRYQNRVDRRRAKRYLKQYMEYEPMLHNTRFMLDKSGRFREFYIDEDRIEKLIKFKPASKVRRVKHNICMSWLCSMAGEPIDKIYRELNKCIGSADPVGNIVNKSIERILDVKTLFIVKDGILKYKGPPRAKTYSARRRSLDNSKRSLRVKRAIYKKWMKIFKKFVGDRRILKVGNEVFWAEPVTKSIMAPTTADGSLIHRVVSCMTSDGNYRQGKKLSKSERSIWDSIPKRYQEAVLIRKRPYIAKATFEAAQRIANFDILYSRKE